MRDRRGDAPAPPGRARPTILVVDDDPGLRDALHLVLDDEYEVIEAADGAAGLAILRSSKINLVLLDLVMPGFDGFVLLEGRRVAHQHVPVIVLSVLNTAWTAAAAMRLGVVDYVTKPFDEAALKALVRSTLALPPAAGGERCVPSVRQPVTLLIGLELGIYASLTVLLRGRVQVLHAETVMAALAAPSSPSVALLIVDLASFGRKAAGALARLRARFPPAGVVTVDARPSPGVPSVAATVLPPPAHVTDLLASIRGHLETDTSSRRRYDVRVGAALDYLAVHYADASVRGLGRAIGASPDYLSARFREEVGLPLKAYISELRVEAAKWLLLEGGEKIETAAVRIGLHDASHLSKLFVRRVGTRPGAYRRFQLARRSERRTAGSE